MGDLTTVVYPRILNPPRIGHLFVGLWISLVGQNVGGRSSLSQDFHPLFCSSIWGSYIDSLPQSVDTPLCWSERELEDLLGGSQLYDSVVGYRQFLLLPDPKNIIWGHMAAAPDDKLIWRQMCGHGA